MHELLRSLPVGVLGAHTEGVRALLEPVHADHVLRGRATEAAAEVVAHLGDVFGRETAFREGDHALGPGRGAVQMYALLLASREVESYWRGLGIPTAVRQATVGEIARQFDKTIRVTGEFGFDDAGWVEVVWRGGFCQVGRLQFELIREGGSVALNTHIPVGGRLSPESVTESLRQGRDLMGYAFGQWGPFSTAVCDSWLLDPQLADIVPGTNIALFGSRWDARPAAPGDGEVLYFAFDHPRGCGDRIREIVPGLSPSSRLQERLVEFWRSGGSLRCWRGTLDLDAV